ncbi:MULTISPECIES: LytR/AlgR family response regulator transcription factor [Chryseobacterium]|uniref:DNA-binding LytR/AlgR family response regulator n=1 Tax=Chryseobacterium camelliae TaxID=1265445 RepID=A0ABU0TLP7_9FLAO|nr:MULTISPECIES: LytTR family DNA-binding domain-containing protein [Chryseobacterium]MDT3408171.1 DNA-binding LytR/AlgR family response regulator [Pseudacidovorax intermedius]MDQ1097973.1 DNA-binding LytR/AlgR family response regulator [Chryseobacterium camelliae]MDQ1101903.1 DNA-binding LytR/AlgR family response regulator [Chryseobacterium sp. SORGH_AS_1048]MDR6085343.1 DNA-binding LytR/AlgR family response regulator [Chryseobacterium sp. SORGH_AS_0909]MDR6129701.1 DNA-binding LytR/AlgR fami
MEKIKCIIVDDEPLAISLLGSYVRKVPFLELVFSVENPISALEYIQNHPSDLIFLDIQMPELTGINFMKILGDSKKYILTTAYSEYALEGYEHNIIDYLLKPVSFERFYKSAIKAKQRLMTVENKAGTYFFVKCSGQQHRINFVDILYVESIKDYVNIRTETQEYIVLDTLKSMENQLPESSFARIHKSFIVNLDRIKSIGARNVTLLSDQEIPMGESYRAGFLQRLK